jgi:hypothetical protein
VTLLAIHAERLLFWRVHASFTSMRDDVIHTEVCMQVDATLTVKRDILSLFMLYIL